MREWAGAEPRGGGCAGSGAEEVRQTVSGAHGSAGCADGLPRGKPPVCIMCNNFAVKISLWWGLTRRLRREGRACSPMRRSIASSGDPKGVQGGERKATLHCIAKRQLCRKEFPLDGD